MGSSVHAPWLTGSGDAAGLAGSLQAGDPQQVGPYRLLGRLGAGGMGQVFLARSAGGWLVAIKVIRPELASDPGFRARFSREIALARRVSGLFTAVVVDADVAGPMPWLATGYVAGPSLDDAVAGQGPLPPDSVLTLAAGLAEGLQAIHAAGLVHRDLKPSNVLLAGDGPRVIDFGISQAADGSVLTQTGTVLGSPGFMSPEQAEGRQVGPRSDVFSLGAVLAFAASGRGPFGACFTPSLMYRVVFHEPDTSRLPVRVRSLVERCLAKDPGQRPTPADLLAQLDASQPAADWLPEPLTSVLGRYIVFDPGRDRGNGRGRGPGRDGERGGALGGRCGADHGRRRRRCASHGRRPWCPADRAQHAAGPGPDGGRQPGSDRRGGPVRGGGQEAVRGAARSAAAADPPGPGLGAPGRRARRRGRGDRHSHAQGHQRDPRRANPAGRDDEESAPSHRAADAHRRDRDPLRHPNGDPAALGNSYQLTQPDADRVRGHVNADAGHRLTSVADTNPGNDHASAGPDRDRLDHASAGPDRDGYHHAGSEPYVQRRRLVTADGPGGA